MRHFLVLMLSLSAAQAALAQSLFINEVQSANVSTICDEDSDYVDWIELYNNGAITINLSSYGLSDDPAQPFKWIFPSVNLPAHDLLLVFASGKNRTSPNLHTNFKIQSSGEPVVLTNPSGVTLDQFETGYIPSDISRGRQPDGGSAWLYFAQPTPEDLNLSAGYPSIANPPLFSLPAGFYPGIITLSLTPPSPQAAIRYTLDGSPPTESSSLYSAPLVIDSTRVVRARTFQPGLLYSDIITRSYLFRSNNDLTVVSLATDPDNFFDWNTGIYVLGPNASSTWPYYGANFWQDWEKPVHVELFDPNWVLGFSLDAGVKIHGGWTRAYAQKPLAIYARDCYGADEIDYPIWPNLPLDEFQNFILRNSGNDWPETMMRDALMTGLVSDLQAVQAYRPAILFLNGQYWGIHNLRETQGNQYLAEHFGVDPDSVDIVEQYEGLVTVSGSVATYNALINYVQTHNMASPANYDYIKTQMDVFNYMDYEAAEIYFANTDWPAYNVKLWRSAQYDGKWRWLLYDTDVGFGLWGGYSHNTLQMATASYNNTAATNLLFIHLLVNTNFRNDFINHFADLLNVNFQPSFVLERIDSLAGVIETEMPTHKARWGQSLTSFTNGINTCNVFAQNRVNYVREDIQQQFSLPGQATVTLQAQPVYGGQIKINTQTLSQFPWSGVYFRNVPIQLVALPYPGYHFSNWIGAQPATACTVSVNLTGNTTITANFAIDDTSAIIITEINYNSAPNFDPEDWVELYNNSDQSVNVSAWIFKDSDDQHQFILPANTVLETGELIVLCRDTSAFSTLFPVATNYIGNFDFGLSNNGELIRLFNAQGWLMDSLTFNDSLPWPLEPNGFGPTLELIHPDSANYLPANWRTSIAPHGSPGQSNYWAFPSLIVSLTPFATPIVIPPAGGSFNFNIAVSNLYPASLTFDLWTVVQLPGSGTVPIITMPNLTLESGLNANRNRTQAVPGNAPAGTYIYWAYVGDYPWTVTNYDSFTFVKSGDNLGDSLGSPSDWSCSGESFDDNSVAPTIPQKYSLEGPYPSPANSSMRFVLELPKAGVVNFTLYDVTGKVVLTLMEGWREAGRYGIQFEVSPLASGLYFARFQDNGFIEVRKVVILK